MQVCLGRCSRPLALPKANPCSRAENGGLPRAMFQAPCTPKSKTRFSSREWGFASGDSHTPFSELPTDSELHGTRGAPGCNLVSYEVAPVRTRIPDTVPRTLPTNSRLRGTGGATGCNLVICTVGPVCRRIPNTFPRTTDGFQTSRNWRCNLVIYEVAPVRTRIPNTVPQTSHGFPTSRNWRCDRVQPRNLRGRILSHPNPKHRSPNYRRIADDCRLQETGSATGCNLVIYEVAPVRTRISNTVPRTTGAPLPELPAVSGLGTLLATSVPPTTAEWMPTSHP